jgi:DNA (cytosine-5)-methyltransferase 1
MTGVGLAASSRVVHRRDPRALPTARGTALRLDPHTPGLSIDPATDRRWLRTARRPWAVDLFCGAGGLSLGLQEAGFTVIAGVDSDPVALETHRANIGGLTSQQDLSEPQPFLEFLRARGVTHVDLVAGGPPCQPFSRAGAAKIRDLVRSGVRSEDDCRVSLWRSFLAVVKTLRPRAVMLENVPDMARWSDGAILVAILDELRRLGYFADARVLKTWEFGVPQHRARLFVVGTSRPYDWPRRRPRVTLRDAIGDLPRISPGQRDVRLAYKPPRTRSRFQVRARSSLPASDLRLIHDHCSRDVRSDDARAYALLQPGQTYRDLPNHLRRYRADIFDDKYKRLSWDDVSRSITAHIAKDGYWYIHPEQDRTLSIREAARIQTFPDRFRFAGHPSVQFRQVGNAVPPALARVVGQRLVASLRTSGRLTPLPSPREDLLRWHASNARSFPWRGERDPWRVLLAEMCLHRTRAENVRSVYNRLTKVARSPTAASRNPARVLEELQPLGLRWRSRKVIETAENLVERFDGRVPKDEASLRSLPGVGDYVASAVRCFAYGDPAVLIDANTRRIVSRISGVDATSTWTVRLEIFRLAGAAGPDEDFNYALLDLGALICRAGKPRCPVCPLRPYCATARRSR